MNSEIRGWAELRKFTGLKYKHLDDLMTRKGFPRPRMIRENKKRIAVWDKAAVEAWVKSVLQTACNL